MPKQKYKITAQIVDHRSVTVSAENESEAVEKAAEHFERRGIETTGGVHVYPVKGLKS